MNSHDIVNFLVIPFEALQLDRDFRKINLTRPFLSEKANDILFLHRNSMVLRSVFGSLGFGYLNGKAKDPYNGS